MLERVGYGIAEGRADALAQRRALGAGFRPGGDRGVGERHQVSGIAVGTARHHHGIAVEHGLLRPGRRHGEALANADDLGACTH
jgi:hypothetical protein